MHHLASPISLEQQDFVRQGLPHEAWGLLLASGIAVQREKGSFSNAGLDYGG